MVTRPIVYRGAKEICDAIGVSSKQILRYVQQEGLPAWRRREEGVWYAIPSDVEDWIQKQRDKYLER